jgi:hypothetical protein
MQVRVKRVQRNASRRLRRGGETAERQDGDVEEPIREAPAAPRANRERRGPPPEDRAVYSCSCGYIFDAHFSTSVECPHCGQTQAW